MDSHEHQPSMLAEPPEAAAIAHALAAVSTQQWADLWAATDAVAAEQSHVTWAGGEVTGTAIVDGVERQVRQMPYPIYSGPMRRLIALISELGLVVPFDWPGWDGRERYRGGAGPADAPAADAVRMVTAIVRSERFCDGAINSAWINGTLPAALARLRAHVALSEPPRLP